MSLLKSGWEAATNRFPRVSGDEPDPEVAIETAMAFSPRERG